MVDCGERQSKDGLGHGAPSPSGCRKHTPRKRRRCAPWCRGLARAGRSTCRSPHAALLLWGVTTDQGAGPVHCPRTTPSASVNWIRPPHADSGPGPRSPQRGLAAFNASRTSLSRRRSEAACVIGDTPWLGITVELHRPERKNRGLGGPAGGWIIVLRETAAFKASPSGLQS